MTHRHSTPCEAVDCEACTYAYPTVTTIRRCVLLVVSYVIDLYPGWLWLVWKSGCHGLLVSIYYCEIE